MALETIRAVTREEAGATPEFAFLCKAVAVALGGPRPAGLAAELARLDPSRLVRLAQAHRCLPLMAEGLQRAPAGAAPAWSALEPALADRVRRALAVGTRRSFLLSRELVSLMEVFGRRGIRAVAWKGPVLAQTLYGRLDARSADDLDIWVHPGDFARACAILEEQAYSPLIRLRPEEAAAHRRAGWDRGFRSPAGDIVVELCVGMAPRYFSPLPKAGAVLSSVVRVNLDGREVTTLGGVALLELLCLHGAKHGWSRLLWLADVAALSRSLQPAEWEVFRRRARRHGGARMMALGVRLACQYFGLPEPVGFAAGARERAWVLPPGLVAQARRFLDGTEPCKGLAEVRFHLAARERWRDRVRYGLLLLFTPGYGDWKAIRLPARWFWLHWLIRPLRRLGRFLLKI
jgi:hypothetical protein